MFTLFSRINHLLVCLLVRLLVGWLVSLIVCLVCYFTPISTFICHISAVWRPKRFPELISNYNRKWLTTYSIWFTNQLRETNDYMTRCARSIVMEKFYSVRWSNQQKLDYKPDACPIVVTAWRMYDGIYLYITPT